MKYANQLWQADTMFGPYVDTGVSPGSRKQAKLIAFIDDASRVLCHGEFFFEENVDTLVQAIRAAFYKRGVPEQLLVDNGSIYCSPGDHPHLRPRRLPPAPHRRSRCRRQGKNRTLFPPRPRPVPRPQARPLLARSPQPPVHPLGRKRLQRHRRTTPSA